MRENDPRNLFRTHQQRRRPTLRQRVSDARYTVAYCIPGRWCSPWTTRAVATVANLVRVAVGVRAARAVADWEWNRIDHFPNHANHRAAWAALRSACPWA